MKITGQDVKNNTIASVDVKNRSLARKDFKPGLLRAGRRGRAGPPGAQGSAGSNGATNVIMRAGTAVAVPTGDSRSASASCLPGERATGGGVFNESNVYDMQVTASYPTPNPFTPPSTGSGQVPTGWRVWVRNTSVPLNVEAYVICASP